MTSIEDRVNAANEGMPLRLTVSSGAGEVTIALEGELDLAGRRPLLDLVAAQPVAGCALDLDARGLAFIDSSGCRAILEAERAARALGAVSVVVVISPLGPVARVLGLTGLDEILQIREVEAP